VLSASRAEYGASGGTDGHHVGQVAHNEDMWRRV
jgi:hypothetical protein